MINIQNKRECLKLDSLEEVEGYLRQSVVWVESLKDRQSECLLITMSVYLTDDTNIDVSLMHILTKDEFLFDYMLTKIQTEVQTYQPGMSKKFQSKAMPAKKQGMGSLLPGDLLSLEMKFKDFGFIADHLGICQPITYLIANIENPSFIDYFNCQSLLSGMLKFAKSLSQMKVTGTRSVHKIFDKSLL